MDLAKVEAAYTRVTQLSGAERSAYLARLKVEDPALAQQVESLLAPDDDQWMRRSVAREAQQLGHSMDPWIGRSIGAYQIRERIAEGGMGAVFLADRTDAEFEQQVAIKVMSSRQVHRGAIDQFRAERQILASLTHPNIAQLLDGGTTDEDVPYLVMEYIDGQPIDQYCDSAKLDIEARLDLFIKVCTSVDYAHRNLVVHRDIKPHNILVTEDGVPKLLDFGIAKLLEEDRLGQSGQLTKAGLRALTPEYASPEQVQGNRITTASDIYSLGVLLYRLLSRRSPYDTNNTTPAQLQHAIVNTDPLRPSRAVTTLESDAEVISEADVRELKRRLVGDLDNIILTMLAKDTTLRYGSVQSVIKDIQCYLQHRPVSARAPSLGYVVGKYVKRNASMVLLSTLALSALAAVVATYTVRLEAERDAANTEAAISQQVTQFVVRLFEGANPTRTNPKNISPKSLLDTGRAIVSEELKGTPVVLARMLGVLSEAYTGMDASAEAIELAQQALDTEIRNQSSKIAIARARARLAFALTLAQRYQEARPMFEQALPAFEDSPPDLAVTAIDLNNRYGILLMRLRDGDAAEQVLRKQLAKVETTVGVPKWLHQALHNNLAGVLRTVGRTAEAMIHTRKAMEIFESRNSPNDYSAGMMHFSLAAAYSEQADRVTALHHYNLAAEIFETVLGRSHSNTATAIAERGSTHHALEQWQEAERDIRDAIAIFTNAYNAEHPAVAQSWHFLGTLYWHGLKDLEGALVHYQRALDIYNASLRETHPLKVYTIASIGGVKQTQGAGREAIEHLKGALEMAAAELPKDHQQVVYIHQTLGRVYHDMGELGAAEAAFESALAAARTDSSYIYTIRPTYEYYMELVEEMGQTEKLDALKRDLKAIEERYEALQASQT